MVDTKNFIQGLISNLNKNDNVPSFLKNISQEEITNKYKYNLENIIEKKTPVQSTTISPSVQTITPSQPVQTLTILDMLVNFIGIYLVEVKPGSRSLDSIDLDEIKKFNIYEEKNLLDNLIILKESIKESIPDLGSSNGQVFVEESIPDLGSSNGQVFVEDNKNYIKKYIKYLDNLYKELIRLEPPFKFEDHEIMKLRKLNELLVFIIYHFAIYLLDIIVGFLKNLDDEQSINFLYNISNEKFESFKKEIEDQIKKENKERADIIIGGSKNNNKKYKYRRVVRKSRKSRRVVRKSRKSRRVVRKSRKSRRVIRKSRKSKPRRK